VSQEPRLQLAVSIKYLVRSILTPLYPFVGVQAGWTTNRLLAGVGTDTQNPDPAQRQVNPLVAVYLGDETLGPGPAMTSGAPITLPPPQGQSSTTTLYAIDYAQLPVTLAIIAAGDEASRIRATAASALITGIGRARTLLLPDTAEQADNAWTPALSTYGLTATLQRKSAGPVDTVDADTRGLRRHHVVYTAGMTYYAVQQSTVIQSVAVTETVGVTVVPTPPTVPPPLP
jgi:hypothetical protein